MFQCQKVRSTWAEDHVHNQIQPTQVKPMTSSQSSVAITAFLWREKQSCTIQAEDVKMDEMLIKEVKLAWFLTFELLLIFQIVSVIK